MSSASHKPRPNSLQHFPAPCAACGNRLRPHQPVAKAHILIETGEYFWATFCNTCRLNGTAKRVMNLIDQLLDQLGLDDAPPDHPLFESLEEYLRHESALDDEDDFD